MWSIYPKINCYFLIDFNKICIVFLIRLTCSIYCNISQYLNKILQYITISFSLAIPTPSRGHWGPVKLPWVPFSGFRRGWKCVSQSEALAAILFFRSAKETQTSFQGGHLVYLISPPPLNLVEDVEILLSVKFTEFRSAVSEENLKICLSVKFPWVPFSGFKGKVENVSANQRPWRPFCFFRSAQKTQTLLRTLISCFLQSLLNSVQRFQRRSRKCV